MAVGVNVDLLEDVDGLGTFLDVQQFDLEEESCSGGNDVAGTLLSVTELWKF